MIVPVAARESSRWLRRIDRVALQRLRLISDPIILPNLFCISSWGCHGSSDDLPRRRDGEEGAERGAIPWRVAEQLLAVVPSEIALPAISVYEVWVGVLGSQNPNRRRDQFEAFLSVVETLPFEAATGRRAAALRHKLERAGEAIGPLDTPIAATALTSDGVLVTRNVREFARVPGLKTVNWHD